MQAFRSRSTDEVVHIPTMMDSKTEQRIILWSAIQEVFESAQSIRNGVSQVQFVKDEDFKQ